jgi:hypothetical protein
MSLALGLCQPGKLAFPALCGGAHVLIQLHDAFIAAVKAWTACFVLMDEVGALQRILKNSNCAPCREDTEPMPLGAVFVVNRAVISIRKWTFILVLLSIYSP